MNTDDRNRFIAQKLNEGLSLAEVQRALAEEGVNMTYLDLRMLAADLQVNWKQQDQAKAATAAKPKAAEQDLLQDEEEEVSATRVTVSKVVRPGAAMSGDVEFASGAKAEWFLDSYGRLGLNPAPGSGKPTEDDLREFQMELQRKLSGEY